MKLNLRVKLLVTVSLITLFGFGLTIFMISRDVSQFIMNFAIQDTKTIARQHAAEIDGELDSIMAIPRAMSSLFESELKDKKIDRDTADHVLKTLLERNKQLLATWICFEPNIFDGKDAEFVGKTGTDKTGRYIPYWNRASGDIKVEPLVDYEKQTSAGDYYNLPKKLKREVAIDPYDYPISGVNVLITSLTVPVFMNGEVIGVAGIDLALSEMQKKLMQLHPYESGTVELLSSTGSFVSHHDTKMIGKDISTAYPNIPNAKEALQKNSEYVYTDEKTNRLHVFIPMHVGESATAWFVMVTIPIDIMMQHVIKVRQNAMIVGLIATLIIIIALLAFINSLVTKPLSLVVNHIKNIVDRCDFSITIPVKREDEIGKAVSSINHLIETNQQAINSINTIMESVSRGDLSQRITHEFNGDFDILKNNINSSLDRFAITLQQVTDNTYRVATTVLQTSRSIDQVAQGSNSQLETISSVVKSISETAQAISSVQQSMEKARENAASTASLTDHGQTEMQQMVQVVNQIADNSEQINRITAVIGEIAEKTNLLALNAAIESARAGETGRGFAVVADEVRKLAEGSASQVSGIVKLVSHAVDQAQVSVNIAETVSGEISQITAAVHENQVLFQEVISAVTQQKRAITLLGESSVQLRNIAESNARAAEEVATTVIELSKVAEDTRTQLERFKF